MLFFSCGWISVSVIAIYIKTLKGLVMGFIRKAKCVFNALKKETTTKYFVALFLPVFAYHMFNNKKSVL